jgi:hypothetical protein
MEKNYGLKIVNAEPDHFILGGGMIGTTDINPSGQWDDYLPDNELQWNGNFDSMNCSVYGTLHAISVLNNFLFGSRDNYSERYTGVLAGTTPTGGDPHSVGEAVRSFGLIPDKDLPFSKDIYCWDDYYTPKPMTKVYLSEGQDFLNLEDFKHEWVYAPNTLKAKDSEPIIKAALKRSPVAISVYAWVMGENGVYIKPQGKASVHWVTCYGFDDVKRAWKIFDSYDNTHKLYSMDSDIEMAKLYWLNKKDQNENYKSFWQRLFNIIKSFISPTVTLSYMKITAFCTAIKTHEGWFVNSRSWRNSNPGNLKFCGQKLSIGQDDAGFAIFKNYADGWTTLTNMITNAALGKSKVYNPEMTIVEFFNLYAPASDKNDPTAYARFVGTSIGADPYTLKLKDLLV